LKSSTNENKESSRDHEMRIGSGYDSHPLVPGRKLILGGVAIPFTRGLLGWSDADVAIHAIIDALCGAADLGDIGTLFPPQDPEYEDISSLTLLAKTGKLVKDRNFGIVNIDVTIIAQQPHLSPFTPKMRERLGQALKIDPARITVKATSTNGLGFIGREEGIAAQAVALLSNYPTTIP